MRCHTVVTDVGVTERRWGRSRVVPWDRVVEVRARTRFRTSMIWLVLADGDAIALPAPISSPLQRDPAFDAKLEALAGAWAAHRQPAAPPDEAGR
nr:PH domain-containing protein [Streptomyces sp. SID3343]